MRGRDCRQCGTTLNRVTLTDEQGWDNVIVSCPAGCYEYGFRRKLVMRASSTTITVEDDRADTG